MGEVTPLHHGRPEELGLSAPAPLDSTHLLDGFDCGKAPLNDWLKTRAAGNEGTGSRTFVVCQGRNVVGYYALAAGAVEHENAPKSLARNMPDPIPVIILGRLAVHHSLRGKKIGAGLLKDALKRALNAAREIGARAVIVHAVDDDAKNFYLQYGFRPFPTDHRTLFIGMNAIAAAL